MIPIPEIGEPGIQVRGKDRPQLVQVVFHKIEFEPCRNLEDRIVYRVVPLLPGCEVRFGIIRLKGTVKDTAPPRVTFTFVPFKKPAKGKARRGDVIRLPHIPYIVEPPCKYPHLIGLGTELSAYQGANDYNKGPH